MKCPKCGHQFEDDYDEDPILKFAKIVEKLKQLEPDLVTTTTSGKN